MAKRRKYKKRSKCPEPFNTLLDIAGGIAMNAIANKMEKKHHYSQKGKINPYKVSAFKIGTGGFNSTEDIVRTGAFLGAIGSFDAEKDTSYPKQKMINVTPEDPIFNQIKYSSAINNKYAWRLNCQDGSEYGVDPYDYETREEYNEALEEAKEYSTLLDYAGIPHKGLHALRHTFATRLINGVKDEDGNLHTLSVKQVADLLGHTTSAVTEKYYVKRETKNLQGITNEFNL